MDSLARLRNATEKVLQDWVAFLGNDEYAQLELVLDRERDRYLLIETGWQNNNRIYGTLLHIDIINDKIWIQHDGTEEGVADELVDAGVSKSQIVLAYQSLTRRQLTEFAVS
jgi:XisI protein